ncbi:MAG: hypothetical protein HY547_05070 [Elusimicrobia bacterium]|nr:hypothetical protein [Elusimicrobiota bacterium]
MKFTSGIYCPWDTIRMVPTDSIKDHKTSLDSQLTHDHAIFSNPEVVEGELRTLRQTQDSRAFFSEKNAGAFEGKPPFDNPQVKELFQKQNPQVPNLMGPK